MLVVLDNNIFVSAMISPAGCPNRISRAWRDSRFTVATCQEQIDELRRISRYPKLRPLIKPRLFGALINDLRSVGTIHRIGTLHHADDPNDAYLLNLADGSGADYLVTGDKRAGLLRKRKIGRASIVTASVFCESRLTD